MGAGAGQSRQSPVQPGPHPLRRAITLFLKPRAAPAQRLGAMATIGLALAGHAALAATPELDGGVAGLRQLATGRAIGLGSAAVPIARPGVEPTAEVNELLKAPLSAEASVRIALLSNPGWQASLAGAGINISDIARDSNPAKLKARQDLTLLSAQARKTCITAVAAASVSRVALAALPEPVLMTGADTAPPLAPHSGRPYTPVVTLNGWTLPWHMNNGVKEFHLVAEPVVREMAPGFKAHMWGYNGQSPGPTIEVVEGDRVRVFVTNRLPEHTSVHWHGQRLPNGMDGVSGLTQPAIPVGKTFVHEFAARRPGTFMYHPHADEMTQMAMGMMGFWVTHPKAKHPLIDEVDRDFVFLLSAYDIDPGTMTPKIMTLLEHNLWTWNNRIFPGIDTLNVRRADKVRIRIGNLTMTKVNDVSSPAPKMDMTGMEMSGGEVKKIDKQAQKITLKHGPIKNLDMPGMTMVFKVADPSLLDKVKAGDTVKFTAEDQGGAMVVTAIEAAK